MKTLSPYIVHCSSIRARSSILRDQPKLAYGQSMLREYIEKAHDVFTEELDIVINIEREFTASDAARLSKMLELLLEARSVWQEEAAVET